MNSWPLPYENDHKNYMETNRSNWRHERIVKNKQVKKKRQQTKGDNRRTIKKIEKEKGDNRKDNWKIESENISSFPPLGMGSISHYSQSVNVILLNHRSENTNLKIFKKEWYIYIEWGISHRVEGHFRIRMAGNSNRVRFTFEICKILSLMQSHIEEPHPK